MDEAIACLDYVMAGWAGERRYQPSTGAIVHVCHTRVEEMIRVAVLCGSVEGRLIASQRVGIILGGRLCRSYTTGFAIRPFLAGLALLADRLRDPEMTRPFAPTAEETRREAERLWLLPPYPASFERMPDPAGSLWEREYHQVYCNLRAQFDAERAGHTVESVHNLYGFDTVLDYPDAGSTLVPLYVETCNGTPKIKQIGAFSFLIRRMDFENEGVPDRLLPAWPHPARP